MSVTLPLPLLHSPDNVLQHITSPDPLAPPAIDPNFLSHDYGAPLSLLHPSFSTLAHLTSPRRTDVAILRDAVKFIQKLVQAKPLADAIACPSFPAALPETDEEIVSCVLISRPS